MNFSETTSASNGGDMGFVTESQLHNDSEVYNAVSKLKPGQITMYCPSTTALVPDAMPWATPSTSSSPGSRRGNAS